MNIAARIRLHHFGFVVPRIDVAMGGFLQVFGGIWDGKIFTDPTQKVRVAFMTRVAEEPQLELVEPVGEDSPVARFLRQQGGGLHHVCYEVADLEHEIAAMREKKAFVAKRPKPAVAFEGRRIAWMLTAEKLLVELLESPEVAARSSIP